MRDAKLEAAFAKFQSGFLSRPATNHRAIKCNNVKVGDMVMVGILDMFPCLAVGEVIHIEDCKEIDVFNIKPKMKIGPWPLHVHDANDMISVCDFEIYEVYHG